MLIDLDNRRAWLELRRAKGFPVLVAERAGQVAGYASYGDWRAFDGYRHTVEHSVYVDTDCRGAGIGRLLMQALIDHARGNDKHVMIAAIEAKNQPSIALHERLGFRLVGIHREVGIKFGALARSGDDGIEALRPSKPAVSGGSSWRRSAGGFPLCLR